MLPSYQFNIFFRMPYYNSVGYSGYSNGYSGYSGGYGGYNSGYNNFLAEINNLPAFQSLQVSRDFYFFLFICVDYLILFKIVIYLLNVF